MDNMTSKVINFNNKIFSQDDIINIIGLFETNNLNFDLVLTTTNEEKITFNSSEALKQTQNFELKDLQSIQIKNNSNEDKFMECTITQGNQTDHANEFKIEAKDESWVMQTLEKVEGLFGKVQEQNSSVFKLKGLFSLLYVQTITFISLLAILAGVTYLIFYNPGEENVLINKFLDKLHGLLIIIYIGSLIPAFFFSVALKDKIMRLWPAIEFNFGAFQSKKEAARKNRIITIVGLFSIPILSSLYTALFVG